jgi:hypothetical protein
MWHVSTPTIMQISGVHKNLQIITEKSMLTSKGRKYNQSPFPLICTEHSHLNIPVISE